jgi:hypothetical protein
MKPRALPMNPENRPPTTLLSSGWSTIGRCSPPPWQGNPLGRLLYNCYMETDKPYTEYCYLCGKPLADGPQDNEHVVPKCLFIQKRGLIELPAHKACNGSFSLDDEYFRLSTTLAAGPHDPIARQVWEGPVMRGFHRPEHPGLKKETLQRLVPVDVHTPAGLYLGAAEAMLQDATRIQRVVNRITRGLYAKQTGKILSLDWPVSSDLINPEAAKPVLELLQVRLTPVGNGVFHYGWKHLEEDDREGLFWMTFYGLVHFGGYTGTKIKALLNPRHERD